MLNERTVRHPPHPEMSEDEFLHALVDGRVSVAIYLKNVRLQGEIESYEPYASYCAGSRGNSFINTQSLPSSRAATWQLPISPARELPR
jgi:hypothetical protein